MSFLLRIEGGWAPLEIGHAPLGRCSHWEVSHREASPGGEASGRPRTRWRNYVSRLAWERLGVPPEELEEVSGRGDKDEHSARCVLVKLGQSEAAGSVGKDNDAVKLLEKSFRISGFVWNFLHMTWSILRDFKDSITAHWGTIKTKTFPKFPPEELYELFRRD
ncbi:hypothetical protein L3Q82_003086 [Scortum barcoo]|uniref:Uncharacterized protein n=1 Tax=Scortum barcoo TaxID=214431 RepID=A0ACB8VRI0_9TELE|nr:hypothetical protein L3Q82_003086 [Scortum barcoo]